MNEIKFKKITKNVVKYEISIKKNEICNYCISEIDENLTKHVLANEFNNESSVKFFYYFIQENFKNSFLFKYFIKTTQQITAVIYVNRQAIKLFEDFDKDIFFKKTLKNYFGISRDLFRKQLDEVHNAVKKSRTIQEFASNECDSWCGKAFNVFEILFCGYLRVLKKSDFYQRLEKIKNIYPCENKIFSKMTKKLVENPKTDFEKNLLANLEKAYVESVIEVADYHNTILSTCDYQITLIRRFFTKYKKVFIELDSLFVEETSKSLRFLK